MTPCVRGLLVVGAELGLEREVDALRLLLFAQLQTVADDLRLAILAVLARGKVALLNGALLGKALGALEEELRAVATAKAADGSGITCQFLSPDFRVTIGLRSGALRPDPRLQFSSPPAKQACGSIKRIIRLCDASADGSRCAESA